MIGFGVSTADGTAWSEPIQLEGTNQLAQTKGMAISKKRTPINGISAPFPRRPNIHTYAA